jgi:hypothetical protein
VTKSSKELQSDEWVMTLSSRPDWLNFPLLEVELAESPSGFLARFRGDLVAETIGVLIGIEPILLNETRVSFDLSEIRSVDQAGLKAALKLVASLHALGARLILPD